MSKVSQPQLSEKLKTSYNEKLNVPYFECLLVTFIFGLDLSMEEELDLAKLAPDYVKIVVDNDRVRVLEVLHKPGAKEPMHSHPAYVAVFLSATRLKATMSDGKVVEKDRRAGEVLWSQPVTHSVENVGTSDQHVIVIELEK